MHVFSSPGSFGLRLLWRSPLPGLASLAGLLSPPAAGGPFGPQAGPFPKGGERGEGRLGTPLPNLARRMKRLTINPAVVPMPDERKKRLEGILARETEKSLLQNKARGGTGDALRGSPGKGGV